MPSASQHHSSRTTKTLLIGDSGAGKTGAKAALVAAGYRVRDLDFDNGADAVIALLTDDRYPYKAYCAQRGIDIDEGYNYITLNDEMIRHKAEGRYVPRAARAWVKMVEMTEDWVDGDIRLGGIADWTPQDVISLDTLGTAAWAAYYYVQQLNGRLGARMEGYDHQRDIGSAQNLMRGLLQKLYSVHVRCNVLAISHITSVDERFGGASMPSRDVANPTPRTALKGYPSTIGRALAPEIGKFFNNCLRAEQSGSGANLRHEIYTQPTDEVFVKVANPAALSARYPVQTALAEIFAALRGEPEPTELITALRPKSAAPTPVASGPAPLQRAGTRPALIPAKAAQ